MKIQRISDLIASLNQRNEAVQNQDTQKVQADKAQLQNAEATKVADDFGRGEASEEAKRSARVQELRQQVAAGQYKPNTREVAGAVYRDLFA